MSIKLSGTKIQMTRGDTAVISVSMTRDGTAYNPVEGDAVRFAMRPAGLNSKGTEYKYPVCLEKSIPIATMNLTIEPEDTAELGFGEYVTDDGQGNITIISNTLSASDSGGNVTIEVS